MEYFGGAPLYFMRLRLKPVKLSVSIYLSIKTV
jgi:hypothetical protein